MKARDYVNNFKNINITSVCKDLKISRANISRGNASEEQYEKVKEELENRIAKLYIKKKGASKNNK